MSAATEQHPPAKALTWQPTVNLRWKKRYDERPMPGGHTGIYGEVAPVLQQAWRCVETLEIDWRPIEVAP